MLHKEFAINPDQIQSLADLRILEGRFGYDKGALISTFPKRWFREVASRLVSQVSSCSVDNVSDDLKAFKSNALISFSREFKADPWLESAKNSHDCNPFHRIVDQAHDNPPVIISSIYELRDDDFIITPQALRTAEALANAGAALLMSAEKVTLFDPYICVSQAGSRNTLLAMMALCQKAKVRFHVFSEADNKPDWDSVLKPALQRLVRETPENIELNWYLVDDNDSGYFHSRGFFTGKGGLIYDRGFTEPVSHDQRNTPADIDVMRRSTHEQKSLDYNEAQLSDQLRLVHSWHSQR